MTESELLAAARQPTTAWLETCFGAGALWRPAAGDLPAGLEHAGARAFLSEVGIPAVRLDFADYDSSELPEKGMWEEDPDELFGNRYPDDDSPPKSYSYCIGRRNLLHLMLRGDTGVVELYDPDGWDHAAGYGGYAADSLPALVGALGLLALHEERLTGGDAAAALAELTVLLGKLGQDADNSSFWAPVLEYLEEEYADEE
ncbi:SUKH-4 family immunity protein [Kitasatospora herbaricolor]|uniref:SUKH-4 family immunity protein n=1 Tax=Kitasatospora herbaricolor TaxID=68217 RepID=UPI0036DD385B